MTTIPFPKRPGMDDATPAKPCVVMVVDDEPMVTTSICTLLSLEDDFDAVGFNHPKEALAAIQAQVVKPDVIISDFLMPDMTGIEFLKAVSQISPDTTRILLTGYADKENAIAAINEASIYRYMEKPWDNDGLLMTLRNAQERTKLIRNLNEKIDALEKAQDELRQYNTLLEERVTEKTHHLTVALDKLKAIVENTGDAILTVSPDGLVQGINPTFLDWVGRSHAQVMEQPVWQYLNFTDVDDNAQLLNLRSHSQIREARVMLAPSTTVIRHVEVNISPLESADGFVMVCRDIGKRKEAERLREDFVSTLTHDLRTPLLAAIQSIGFFLDGTLGPLTPQQHEMLAMLVSSNQQMLSLVNVLLEVYRYEAKQQRLIMEDIQLADIVQSVVLELHGLTKAKEQTLETTIAEPLPLVYGDRQAIRRVLTNVIANAHNHTSKGSHITVSAEIRNETVVIAVQDNGRGIPENDLKKLFQRFSQGTSKHRNTGTGLGLYLCKQIIDAHGGAIWAESKEGEGCRFYIELRQFSNKAIADMARVESQQLGVKISVE